MKLLVWYLLIQVTTTWPQNPQQLQVFGPMNERGMCLDAKAQLEHDFPAVHSNCLSIGNDAPPAASPVPVQPAPAK